MDLLKLFSIWVCVSQKHVHRGGGVEGAGRLSIFDEVGVVTKTYLHGSVGWGEGGGTVEVCPLSVM